MRTALTLAALLALSAPSQGQGVSLGVAGGANFASLADARAADIGNATGYHVGLYADVSVPVVAFRTGVYYLRAGDLETVGGEPVAAADFVAVPLDFRLRTPTPAVQAYLLVGPEARFAVETDGDRPTISRTSPNVAGTVGLGVGFASPLGGSSGFLEARYSRDLTGFAEDAGLTTDNAYRLDLIIIRAGLGL